MDENSHQSDNEPTRTATLLEAIASYSRDKREYLTDAGDISLKLLSSEGVLKEIPVVKWVAKAFDVRDAHALRKLRRNTVQFLAAVQDNSGPNIESLRDKLLSDSHFNYEFQDILADILIEGSRPLKSYMLGRFVWELSHNEISPGQFETYSHIIHSASMCSLKSLNEFMTRNQGQPYLSSNLVPEEPFILSMGLGYRHGNMFRISSDGEELWKYGFKGWQDSWA